MKWVLAGVFGIALVLWLIHVNDPLLVSYLYPVTGKIEDNNGVYQGEIWNKLPSGHGTYNMTIPDGTSYVGEWKDGKYHGRGTMTYPLRGMRYVGEFKEGKKWKGIETNKDGLVTTTYADGIKYLE